MYRHLLHDRIERNVRPMTEQCLEIKELEAGGKELSWWPSLTARLECVSAPRFASFAADVDKLVSSFDVPAKGVKLFLQGEGFSRIRRHLGVAQPCFYVFHVPSADGRQAGFVRVKGSSED